MSVHLVQLIATAMQQQIDTTGSYDPMQIAEDVFEGIEPKDYAETLRIVIFQWVAITPIPERSTA